MYEYDRREESFYYEWICLSQRWVFIRNIFFLHQILTKGEMTALPFDYMPDFALSGGAPRVL